MRSTVELRYVTGLSGRVLDNVTALAFGSWDAHGRPSSAWSAVPMMRETGPDGGVRFRASVSIEADDGQELAWRVVLTYPDGSAVNGIATEVHDRESRAQERRFTLHSVSQLETYFLTQARRLGANKIIRPGGRPGLGFAVWAPNARSVEVVIGLVWSSSDPMRTPLRDPVPAADLRGGYIAADGAGIDPTRGPFAMTRGDDGVWTSDSGDPRLADFAALDHAPYMFKITREDGSVRYRTDLYSRCQLGYGATNPRGERFDGSLAELDGSVSCSVVVDPDRVTRYFQEEPPYVTGPDAFRVWPEREFVDSKEFWADEHIEGRPLPSRVEDLIIYELHVGALGFGSTEPGTLEDALELLDHLQRLGVNAVELMPLSEFGGIEGGWGYSTSHYFAIEYSGGGRDEHKHFIKACHQRGIAVIMDVVYNHYAHDAERAEYRYDSSDPSHDIYYWYEGAPTDYPQSDGGYVDNLSTAYAPRYHEEFVRSMFIGSASVLLNEFHVDGFRVDQTTSIHAYNVLHADGRPLRDANLFGAKLLREMTRTLRLIKPSVIMIAEDHSDWTEVTLPIEQGGIGMDAKWYSGFYHHLIGDTQGDYAKLVYQAAQGDGRALPVTRFAGTLASSGDHRVVYSESHDEAGNSEGPFRDPDWTPGSNHSEYTSHRTLAVAVNGAPLVGETRRYAEARARFAYGMAVLSAGTPMFLFGEEVGAEQRFTYDTVLHHKEDLHGLLAGSGAPLFAYYAAINRLRLDTPALRSRNVEVVYVHDEHRLLTFRRWIEIVDRPDEEYLVVSSLADHPYDQGYVIAAPALAPGRWREVFTSDAAEFGGWGMSNGPGPIDGTNGSLQTLVPAAGLVILRRETDNGSARSRDPI